MRTLLLDNSYYPVKVINWQKAMVLLLAGRAEVVDEYEEINIRSVTTTYKLPKILRLFTRHQRRNEVRFTRYNVFWRDEFTCQYCAKKFNPTQLTFDHVLPKSKGGETNWENVVSCCTPCNSKKGSRSLSEVAMKLLKAPIRPKWTPQLFLRLKGDYPLEWGDFIRTFSYKNATKSTA